MSLQAVDTSQRTLLPLPTPAADAKQVPLTEPKQVSEQPMSKLQVLQISSPTGDVYAGPAVRKMAREIGLDLGRLFLGSGPKRSYTKR